MQFEIEVDSSVLVAFNDEHGPEWNWVSMVRVLGPGSWKAVVFFVKTEIEECVLKIIHFGTLNISNNEPYIKQSLRPQFVTKLQR